MKLRHLCSLLLVPVIVFAAAALPIEFNGVLIQGGKTTVSLLNPNTGTAKWVAVGGKFDTYLVTSYLPDPKGADAVILTKAGTTQTLRVVLKNSLILAADSPAPVIDYDHMTDTQLNALRANMDRLQVAANQYCLAGGVDSVTVDQLVGPGKLIPVLTPAVGESYSGLIIKKDQQSIRVELPGGKNFSYGTVPSPYK